VGNIEVKPYNSDGARWCVDHVRYECSRNSRTGRFCHNGPVQGTGYCCHHQDRMSIGPDEQQMITAWSADGNPSVDVEAVVMGLLHMTWIRARYYAELLRRQVEKEGAVADNASSDSPEASGLIGFEYGAGGRDGRVYVRSEAVRALVLLEAAERNRAAKYAEQAHKMGISNRMTEMAEQWSNQVAGNLAALLLDLGLTPEQQSRVPELMKTHLGSVNIGVTA
jgi:hypothetical protein